jgi:hypothetical protein
MPAAVPDRVVERSSDRTVRSVKAGSAVDQDLRHLDVVGAGRPVERGLGSSATGVVVGVGPRIEKKCDRLRAFGKKPGQSVAA